MHAALPRAVSRPTAGHLMLAAVMIGLGLRGLVVGDFASVWQRIPIAHLPGREYFAYACAVVELATGVGILVRRTLAMAAAVLAIFLLLWIVLLKLPAVIAAPQMEATWLGVGEISVILAGAWTLYALHAGDRARARLPFIAGPSGVRHARVLFALALPAIGLSHFIYAKFTADFVPAWLPWHYFWAYLTGAGNIAAALGVLCKVRPQLAATLEAAMLGVITLLVWGPGLFITPGDAVTGFLISSAIACGAWMVADSYRRMPI